MSEFFKGQADYLFFIYSLTFVILGTVCFINRKSDSSTLSLTFLGFFGFAYGLHEWMEMPVLAISDSYWSGLLHLVLMLLSFMFLFEFCRVGIAQIRGSAPVGRWIFIPPLLLVMAGGILNGQAGLDDGIRFGFGLVSSITAAIILYLWGQAIDGKGARALTSAALGMAGYGLTIILVIPESSLFVAQLPNETTFLATTGIPIQLVRIVFVSWIAGSILRYEICKREYPMPRKSVALMNLGFAVFGVMLVFGGILTNYFDKLNQQNIRDHITVELTILTERLSSDTDNIQRVATIMAGFIHNISNTERITPLLDRFASIGDGVIAYVIDTKGKLIASSNRNTSTSPAREYYVYRSLAETDGTGNAIYRYAFSNITHKPVFYVGIPIADENNYPIGVAILRKNIQIDQYRLTDIYASFLVDGTGRILLFGGMKTVPKNLWHLPKNDSPALFSHPLIHGEKVALNKQMYIVGRKVINKEGWSMVVLEQESASSINRLFAIIMTLLVCSLTLVLLVILQKSIFTELELRHDHEELRKLSEAFKRQSITDTLTGAYNRLKFDTVLEIEMKSAMRYQTSLTLIMYDIDHFKLINDTYGHQTGDGVLKELTALVTNNIRSSDTLARWGGEEFMIIVPHDQNARALAEKLRYVIEHHDFEKIDQLTCSFGVASLISKDTPETFTARADDALYEAKLKGRNRVEI